MLIIILPEINNKMLKQIKINTNTLISSFHLNAIKNVSKIKATTSVVIGAILYKGCVAAAIELGMSATDMKLITSTLFLIILIATMDRKKKVK